MIRRVCIAFVVAAVAGGVPRSLAQPPPGVLSSSPPLDEAEQLAATVEGLYAEGKFQEAIPLARRSLLLRERVLGPMHPDVAESLSSLAKLHYAQALGPMHPSVATSLHNLAGLYRDQGAYAKAEPVFVRALGIFEKALGPMHPHVASSLNNLAVLYSAQDSHGGALRFWTRAAGIREEGLRVGLARLSELRKRALMTLLQGETDKLVSLHATHMPRSRRALELALKTVLQRKGRVLDSLVEHEATLRAHLTTPVRVAGPALRRP